MCCEFSLRLLILTILPASRCSTFSPSRLPLRHSTPRHFRLGPRMSRTRCRAADQPQNERHDRGSASSISQRSGHWYNLLRRWTGYAQAVRCTVVNGSANYVIHRADILSSHAMPYSGARHGHTSKNGTIARPEPQSCARSRLDLLVPA